MSNPYLEAMQGFAQQQQIGQRAQLFPFEKEQARFGAESARLGAARGGIELRQLQEEEERRRRLSRGRGPLSQQQERLGIKRALEQQEYEDRMRPQMRQFEELQRAAQAQELQSKMAFRPAFDQLRMNMMGRMGATSFGPMAGGPQPMGGFGGSQYGGFGGQMPFRSPFGAEQSALERSGGLSTTPQFTPAPWMRSYTAPTFPR